METRIVKLALGVMLLASIAAPRFATAAVVVAEPTGNADPAFLAELKASLETVAAEAPAEMDAELRASATVAETGVELVVELVPRDGGGPIRESRTASKASALTLAQYMARALLKAYMGLSSSATEPTAPTPAATATVPQSEKATPPSETEEEPDTLPLPVKYDRHKALAMSMLLTAAPHFAGGIIAPLSFFATEDDNAFMGLGVSGSFLIGAGLILGPSTGYFWIGRTSHALVMSGVRLLTVTTAIVTTWLTALAAPYTLFPDDCMEDEIWGMDACAVADVATMLAVVATVSFTASLIIAYIDAGLVGRAADRANAEWRDKNKPTVTVAPMAWSNGNGDGTFGLAVSGSF